MKQMDGIEGPAEKGARDGEGHRSLGESPETITEGFLEMSQAGPSSPMGTGDCGRKNQSLNRDRDPISPGALQIKTQTPVISHDLHCCPGGLEKAVRNWCLGKDLDKRDGEEDRLSRGRDLPKPQPVMVSRHSDAHIQRL